MGWLGAAVAVITTVVTIIANQGWNAVVNTVQNAVNTVVNWATGGSSSGGSGSRSRSSSSNSASGRQNREAELREQMERRQRQRANRFDRDIANTQGDIETDTRVDYSQFIEPALITAEMIAVATNNELAQDVLQALRHERNLALQIMPAEQWLERFRDWESGNGELIDLVNHYLENQDRILLAQGNDTLGTIPSSDGLLPTIPPNPLLIDDNRPLTGRGDGVFPNDLFEVYPVPSEWADADALAQLSPIILEAAARWNPPNSSFTDEQFAALMMATLHEESRLRRRNPALNDFHNQLGIIRDIFADAVTLRNDGSFGISNIRPSVAREIINEIIPTGADPIPFEVQALLGSDANQQLAILRTLLNMVAHNDYFVFLLLNDDTVSIELLAANLSRGVIRAQYLGLQPTVFNLSAWHNQGYQDQGAYQSGDKAEQAFDHANRVLESYVTLLHDPSAVGLSAQISPPPFYNQVDEPYVENEQ